MVLSVRHQLYDSGMLHSENGVLKTVVVGNLELGGTGKSQLTMLLAELLSDQKQVAILSRGYGRSTSGYVEVDGNSGSTEVGDEPIMFKRRFPNLPVAVCEDRIEGLKQIKTDHPQIELVLLDDAFQHRSLKPDFSVLVTDFQVPYFRQNLLPAGRLRDVVWRAKFANMLMVTGCPDVLENRAKEKFIEESACWGHEDVIFTRSKVDLLIPLVGDPIEPPKKAWLLSGIARSERFENSASTKFQVLGHLALPDHHQFNKNDLSGLREKLDSFDPSDVCVLMTEKDAARADHHLLKKEIHPYSLFYLPLRMEMEGEIELRKKIIDHVFGEN